MHHSTTHELKKTLIAAKDVASFECPSGWHNPRARRLVQRQCCKPSSSPALPFGQIWDLKTKKLKMDLPGHADEVFAVRQDSNTWHCMTSHLAAVAHASPTPEQRQTSGSVFRSASQPRRASVWLLDSRNFWWQPALVGGTDVTRAGVSGAFGWLGSLVMHQAAASSFADSSGGGVLFW